MSFGSSGFGFGANNQNQTQPAANTGFGGFGATNTNNTTTGGFGTTGNTGFGGGNNNTTGGGLFGGAAANTNTASSGFGSGGFGSTNNQQTSGFGSRPGFGSTTTANTSTGGSLFGGGNTTASTGFGGFGSTQQQSQPSTGFGSSPSGGGLFGQNNQQQQAQTGFGTTPAAGSSLFGGTAGFGNSAGSNTGFNQSTNAANFGTSLPTQNQGTGGTPFSEHSEKDNSQTSKFQSITCLPQYVGFSFEELRVVDYNQGRRYGTQSGQAGAFGAGTGFGGFGQTNNAAATTTAGFGSGTSGGMFGQQPAVNTGGFGSAQPAAATGFGQSTSLFGQSKPAGTGLFGSTPAAPATTGGGLFGTANNTTANTGFGQTTGGFGSTSTGTGIFGGQQQPAKSLFGQPAGNTGTGFGAASTGGFGQQPAATGSNLFGQSNTQSNAFGQPQAAQTSSPFGGGFGQNNQAQPQQNQTQGGGLFGSGFGAQNQAKPLFGNANATTGTTPFGQAPQQQPAGGLFGNLNNQNQQSGGLFGPKPAAASNLFGGAQNNAGGGGLFGGANNTQQQTQGNSLFGQTQQQKPSLFGASNSNSTGGGLFGNLNQSTNQQPGGGSLFGNSQNQQSQLGFGNSLQQQPQQNQQLTTSIMSNNPYGNDHLFANLGTPPQAVGPLATPLSSSQKARKPAPLPTYRLNPAASSRLITPQKHTGYGFDYSSYGTPGSAYSNASPSLYGSSLLQRPGSTLGRSLSASNIRSSLGGPDSILNANAFSTNGLRASGSAGLKRLNINRTIRTDLFGVAASEGRSSPLKKNVTFEGDQTNGESQHKHDNAQANGASSKALVRVAESDSATPSAEEQGLLRSSGNSRPQPRTNGNASRPEKEQPKNMELAVVPEDSPSSPPVPPKPTVSAAENARRSQKDREPGDYYMIPSRAELDKMSRKQLSSVKPFIVGREFTARIEFFDVDLTNVDLDKICGGIVRLETRSATVYADHVDKQPPGKGLNVHSRVTLDNSWPRSKGGSLPVYERKGPKFDKHIQRLQRVDGTYFEEYRVETGQWVFRVDHFSTYRLDYGDDDGDMSSSMLSAPLDSPTPIPALALQQSGKSPNGDNSMLSNSSSAQNSNIDDTFEFRRSRGLPGAFDDDVSFGDDMDMDERQEEGSVDTANDYHGEETTAEPNTHADGSSFDDDVSGQGSIQSFDGTVDTPSKRHSPSFGASVAPKSILKASQQQRTSFGTPSRVKPTIGADWATQLQRTISPKKQDRQALRESQGIFSTFVREKQPYKPGKSTFGREAAPFATSLDVMNSLFGTDASKTSKTGKKQTSSGKGFQWPYAKRSKSDLDANNMTEQDKAFHKSFKPSWARDGTLIYASATGNTTGGSDILVNVNTPVVSEGKDVQFARFATASIVSPVMKLQQELSQVVLEDGVPRVQLNHDMTFSDFVSRVHGGEDGPEPHELPMWQLASILFDDIDSTDLRADQVRRKEDFEQFWKHTVSEAASRHTDTASTPEEQAIAQLSANDVWAATETLSAGRDFRLAALIAQIGSHDSMRQGMADQLDDWRRSDVIAEMSPMIRVLYELLAGNTCVSDGKGGVGRENKAETFNISARLGLDWKRAFGLKLWYGTDSKESLADAINKYWEDLTSLKETVKPVPWFVEQKASTGWDDQRPQDRQDILWGLLKIYASTIDSDNGKRSTLNLGDVLSPQNLAGNPVEARLSFQLYHALCALQIIDFDELERDFKADLLATDYAFQLASSSDYLCDAVFVTLHLSDAEARRSAVVALLNRHAEAIGDGRETSQVFKTLADDLKIPEPWIWTAKALHAKAVLSDEVAEVHCLLRAGELEQAHATLKNIVAPRAIIEEDLDGLKHVLEAFVKAGAAGLRGWETGGGVYVDFVTLSRSVDDRQRKALARKVLVALPRMSEGGRSGLEETVAVSEMGFAAGKLVGQNGADVTLRAHGAGDAVLREAMRASDAYYAKVLVGGR